MSAPFSLFLVRHGNTFESWDTPKQIGIQTDLALTQQGKEQSKKVAAQLRANGISPTQIFCGKLKRQFDSAKIIATELGFDPNKIEIVPELDEIDYGAWEGLTVEEIKNSWAKEYDAWERKGEADPILIPDDIETRIAQTKAWLESLRSRFISGQRTIAVTSNGVMRLFYAQFCEDWERLKKERKVDEIKVKPGNFCEIEIFPDKLLRKCWNVTPT